MKALSLKNLFSILFVLFLGLFAATALQAWTGPTTTAPGGNVAAPVNVGTTDQVKNSGLSVNALTVFGSQYIQTRLGVGAVSPVVSIETPGTIKIGDGGEVCQSVTAGGIRYHAASSTLEYCNGSNWKAVNVTTTTSLTATRTYNSSATWSKPANLAYVIVDIFGAGGGGACGGESPGTGGTGGSSVFSSASASGGAGGSAGGSGAGGTGSGGDINLVGSNSGTYVGGTAANSGPGNGGIACYDGDYGYTGGGGGGGGYAQKTIQAADLGSTVSVTVGGGGYGGGVHSYAYWGPAAPGIGGRVVVKEYTTQ